MGSNVTTYGNRGGQQVGANWSDSNPPAVATAIAGASFDTGPIGYQKISGWTKVKFQLVASAAGGAFTGYSVQVYGTDDLNTATAVAGWTGAAGEWVPIPAPSGSSADPSNWTNPLTARGQSMFSNAPWVAYRCVVTGTAQTGSLLICVFGTP